MAFTQKDLSSFVRGDDWAIKLTVTSNNNILNITGYTYWLTLKVNMDDLDANAALQVQIVPESADAVQGVVIIKAPAAQTSLLEPISYFYDIQQVDTNGEVQTLMIGKVKVIKDVTRSIG